jgi:hypothetical protein
VGLLGLFPIHAAGSESHSGQNAMDHGVSSYAMTMKSLEFSRRVVNSTLPSSLSVLVVTMPETPCKLSLPPLSTKKLETSNALFPNQRSRSRFCYSPRRPRLFLGHHSQIVHFACHVEVDVSDPSESRPLLMDWESDPFTVANIVAMKFDTQQMAIFQLVTVPVPTYSTRVYALPVVSN